MNPQIIDELCFEVLDHRIKNRMECASQYAVLIRIANIDGDLDVSKLNDAIIIRWSRSGLNFIKNAAWKIAFPGEPQ